MTVITRKSDFLVNSGNPFKDTVDNTVEILKREIRDDPENDLVLIKKVHSIFDSDVLLIPRVPAIAVTWMAHDEKVRTLGHSSSRKTLHVYERIYYYHSELSQNIRKEEIRDAVWELTRIVGRNADLNGLSQQGILQTNSQIFNRARDSKIYAGAYIDLQVPIDIRDRRGLSK